MYKRQQLGGQELGEYAVETSAFCRIDRDARLLLLESGAIPLENIQEIRLPEKDGGEPAGRRPAAGSSMWR